MQLTTIATLTSGLCLTAGLALGQTTALTNTPPKSPPWDISAAAGLTLTRGNSDTLLFTANVAADKKWGQNEVAFGADGVYGENNNVVNANQLHGFGQYNRLFTDRFFGYLRADGLHDEIAGINYRLTIGPGVGYYFIKTTNTLFRGEFGPGYLYERDTDGTTHSYMTLRFAERFEQKLSDSAKFWEAVEFLPQVDRFNNYIVNAEIGFETTMTKKLSLLTYLQDSYHSEPPPGRLKNDLKLVAAFKYKF